MKAKAGTVVLLAAVGCAAAPPSPSRGAPHSPHMPREAPPSAAKTATAILEPSATVDDDRLLAYAATRSFRLGAPVQMTPTPDGRAVVFLRSGPRDPKQSLFELDRATGATRELVSPETLLTGAETLSVAEQARRERMRERTTGFTAFELSEDGARILLTLSGRLFVLTRLTGAVRELPTGHSGTDPDAVIDPRLSHDGTRVAYVRASDLYVLPIDGGAERALTRGGTERVSHGTAEFIAEEELDRTRGFWWAPDDTSILYEEANTSGVARMVIADPAHPEQPPNVTSYPRAGTANAVLRFGFVPARGGQTTWIALDGTRFPYVPTVTWEKEGPPTLYVLDRLQKNGVLVAVDPLTGKTTPLLTEHDDAWLEVDPTVPRWLPGGHSFLWASDRDGSWRLEERQRLGGTAKVLTTAAFGYRAIDDVDPTKGIVYVTASAEPTDAGLYAVPLDGRVPRAMAARPRTLVSARFGKSHDVLAVTEQSADAMPRYWTRAIDGAELRPIASMTEMPSILPAPELTTAGADEMHVAIVRPRTFVPGRRYPVIDSAYAGPQSSVVTANALRFVLEQWIADRADAIVVSIDARGTPNRGRAWERAIEGKLGSIAVEGHVAALDALATRYPEIDRTRVGVYGWSFGGYYSALAVLSRPDVYRVGAAAAPVADWRDYDTCYTERYLGLPEASPASYDAASLLPLASSPPRTPNQSPLLVVHGTADDNVYFFHSLKLVDALERAGRPFEFLPIAGMTHVPRDPERLRIIFSRVADFLREGLRTR